MDNFLIEHDQKNAILIIDAIIICHIIIYNSKEWITFMNNFPIFILFVVKKFINKDQEKNPPSIFSYRLIISIYRSKIYLFYNFLPRLGRYIGGNGGCIII
jgi:hypothetical protein